MDSYILPIVVALVIVIVVVIVVVRTKPPPNEGSDVVATINSKGHITPSGSDSPTHIITPSHTIVQIKKEKCTVPVSPTYSGFPFLVNVTPVFFTKSGQYGDMTWMITQPEYMDALFIFNDNASAFKAHSCNVGAGNGNIRPFQCKPYGKRSYIQVIGIPTGPGWSEKCIPQDAKDLIDDAIRKARALIEKNKFKQVYYNGSANQTKPPWGDKIIGSHTFRPSEEVKDYITEQLHNLAS